MKLLSLEKKNSYNEQNLDLPFKGVWYITDPCSFRIFKLESDSNITA